MKLNNDFDKLISHYIKVKGEEFVPEMVIKSVRECLDQGDLLNAERLSFALGELYPNDREAKETLIEAYLDKAKDLIRREEFIKAREVLAKAQDIYPEEKDLETLFDMVARGKISYFNKLFEYCKELLIDFVNKFYPEESMYVYAAYFGPKLKFRGGQLVPPPPSEKRLPDDIMSVLYESCKKLKLPLQYENKELTIRTIRNLANELKFNEEVIHNLEKYINQLDLPER